MYKLSIVASALLLTLMGCDSSPQQTDEIELNKIVPSDASSYSNSPMKNTWPKTGEEGIALASDLLATNYYLVLDGSGSMQESRCSGKESKMNVAKRAVSAFAQQIPANANLGLYVFDDSGRSERVTLQANNRNQMVNAIRKVKANAGTPLRTAVTSAYHALEQQAKKQLGYGEYHLVVITDGEANEAQEPDKIVDKILKESPIVLHTIGFCIKGGHSLNQPGRIDYKQANDPASLSKGLQEVLAESPSFQQDEFEG